MRCSGVATLVQMIGVVILVFGLPVSFETAAKRGKPQQRSRWCVGYVIMRVPLIGLWIRAARQDPAHHRIDIAYAVTIAIAQARVGTVRDRRPASFDHRRLSRPAGGHRVIVPVVLERRLGRPPWNAGHIAERFSLLTLIVLGEVIAATTSAVTALTGDEGWSPAAVGITASGMVLAAGFWWAYFLIPSRTILERWPDRTYAWRYAHLPISARSQRSAPACGSRRPLSRNRNFPVLQIALALAIPVAILVAMIFVNLLERTDEELRPKLRRAIFRPDSGFARSQRNRPSRLWPAAPEPIDRDDTADLTMLAAVVGLIALAAVVEVVGHELVGYRHTLQVVSRDDDVHEPQTD